MRGFLSAAGDNHDALQERADRRRDRSPGEVKMGAFEPKILGFLCNWCSYAGADLAGVSRIQYATNLRVIRVMCSGRVDPIFILNAFLRRIDGVLVLGCHFGDCHYINGNYSAEKRILAARKVLSYTALEPQRLCLDWVSAAEGDRFAMLVNDFVNKIKELGPIAKNGELREELLAVRDMLAGESFRHISGVAYQVTEVENVYGEKLEKGDFERKFNQVLYQEYVRHRIMRMLQAGPHSIPELSSGLAIPEDVAFSAVCALQEKGLVLVAEFINDYPRYQVSR
jgi:NADH-quinone oxidoreductase subunit E